MFRGQYAHAIDEKGRTSVPSRFREILAAQGESRLVITAGVDPCLVAYPMKEWIAFEERLSQLPRFDPSVAMIRRLYVSGAVEVELDKVGRLLIPQTLRELAELEREALWAGMGKHIELWSKERFAGLRAQVLADESAKQKMAERLAELGL
ncbi:division/cell wall cluster transcriptional repressor MraZ [Sandaracinus amylolyticus]|uniref:division/cell wall cluster transcriptional repressor MraZ n=1 Tax=Sandaracinus amylolyticus TaxID=927083 RepID=UPI00069E261F|nr:division/cell wall cluster transcriptional repressor MraZ [Sandaracinus amylolyticus]UJR80116.1 Cell division/cell wall cluster transcriptional repressor MraZ [Sandaracinus amylolyticus]